MKKESLVIVDQHATVNPYLSLVLPARHALEVKWVGSHSLVWGKNFSFIKQLISVKLYTLLKGLPRSVL